MVFAIEVKLLYGVEDELVFLFCWVLNRDVDFIVYLD